MGWQKTAGRTAQPRPRRDIPALCQPAGTQRREKVPERLGLCPGKQGRTALGAQGSPPGAGVWQQRHLFQEQEPLIEQLLGWHIPWVLVTAALSPALPTEL